MLLEGAGKEKERRDVPGDWDPKFFLLTGTPTQRRDEVSRNGHGFRTVWRKFWGAGAEEQA